MLLRSGETPGRPPDHPEGASDDERARAPRRGLLQRRRQADTAPLARRPAALAWRSAGERRRDPQARRGLSPDDGGGLQAALLRGPLRARPARHRDRGGRPGPRRRRGLQPAGQRLLPAGRAADARRAHGARRLPGRARRPLRLLQAPAAGPGQPRAGPSGTAGRCGGAGARRPAGPRRRRRRRPAQAAGSRSRPQDGRLPLLRDRPRRGARTDGRPVRPAVGRRRVVRDRLLPHAQGRAHLPAVAHPLAR